MNPILAGLVVFIASLLPFGGTGPRFILWARRKWLDAHYRKKYGEVLNRLDN